MQTKESGEIQKIFSVLPEDVKVEAIDYLEFLYSKYVKDTDGGNKERVFGIINNYKGIVQKWTREELHER